MKRFISLFLLSLFINLSVSSANDGLPPNNKIVYFAENGKIVIRLDGIDTEGLQLQMFNAAGELVENQILKANMLVYAIEKPEKGIYWLYLKVGINKSYQRISVR